MAYFGNKIRHKLEPQQLIHFADGINTLASPFEIKKSECVSCSNVITDKYPSLSTRMGLSASFGTGTSSFTNLNGIGVRNDSEIHIHTNTTWQRWTGSAWATIATGLANVQSKIFEYNREAVRLTVLVNGTDRKAYDGSTVIDLWTLREGVAYTAKTWDLPVVVNKKMYVRMTNTVDIGKVGIYDIDGDTWSLGADLGQTWNHPVRVGAMIYVSYLDGLESKLARYDTQAGTWSSEFDEPLVPLSKMVAIGNYLYSISLDPGGEREVFKYSIDEDYWDENTGPSTACHLIGAIDGIIYAKESASPYRIYKYDTIEEVWNETFGTSPGGTNWDQSSSCIIGTKIYTKKVASPYNMLIYDTVKDEWDLTSGGTPKADWNGAAVVESVFDTQILSRGVGDKVVKYNFTFGVWGDDVLFEAPKTNLYTKDDYRIYALEGTVLEASDIMDPYEWVSGDSCSIPVTAMKGSGTAITRHQNMTILWSEQTMHLLLGNVSENYKFTDIIDSGCVGAKAFCEHDGVLYYCDIGKLMAFTGGLPKDISQKVSYYFNNINQTHRSKICVAGHGNYIYVSMPEASYTSNTITLVYNKELGTWHTWNIGIYDFVKVQEALYGLGVNGVIYKFNTGTADGATAITWSYITGAWFEGAVRQQKVISDLYALVDLPTGSTLKIEYATTVAGTSWTTLFDFTASATDYQRQRVQIPTTALQCINWYRLKLSGSGPCTIYYIEPQIRIKTR